MKVVVIGGAGAFSKDNSSFLIENEEKGVKILFDCGDNAFHYAKDNDIDIDYVYISHTHMDHIGGLEKLIYFNYFVKNKVTRIMIDLALKEELQKFLPKQQTYENGELHHVLMYTIEDANSAEITETFPGNHVVTPNYGLIIRDEQNSIIITGDTKASKIIANVIKQELDTADKVYVFHDYQTFGSSINSVHCCKDDFEFYYKDFKANFKVRWYLYHNEKFNENYKNKVIFIG